jgi:hypothetical protein
MQRRAFRDGACTAGWRICSFSEATARTQWYLLQSSRASQFGEPIGSATVAISEPDCYQC